MMAQRLTPSGVIFHWLNTSVTAVDWLLIDGKMIQQHLNRCRFAHERAAQSVGHVPEEVRGFKTEKRC
jgi:hypothetical protein